MENFTGFTPATLAFLHGLEENNTKAWFEANKNDYQAHLLAPFMGLVGCLAPAMLAIDPLFETRPVVDKTLSRMHRDIRFSRDKSPFRARMWLVFKQPGQGWQERPAFFFELEPKAYRFGMGFYAASKPTMDMLRRSIEENPDDFSREVAFLEAQSTFTLEGEMYKRTLNPGLPENLRQWHNRKNVHLLCNRINDDRLFSSDLADVLSVEFAKLAALYHFFCSLVAEAA